MEKILSGKRELTLRVEGMSCQSCERKVADALSAVPGVISATANHRSGFARVAVDASVEPSVAELTAAVAAAGYAATTDRKGSDALLPLGIGLILSVAYLVARATGAFNYLPNLENGTGVGALFILGALTSVHCVAMCGGLALSANAVGGQGRILPVLLYNSGRALSYALIGGLAGGLGSALGFSPMVKGFVTLGSGVFMIVLSLRRLGFPPLGFRNRTTSSNSSAVSSGFSRLRDRLVGSAKGSFAVGLLNGLMPCGPLQTVQIYALGTGSFLAGSVSMLAFALGTIPLMLAFGASASILPRRLVPAIAKASAVLLLTLGVANIGRAMNLSGVSVPGGDIQAPWSAQGRGKLPEAIVEGGVQRITTEFKSGYYVPFSAKAGVPLEWTIRVGESDLNGCNNPVQIPGYGIEKSLELGDNLITFIPEKPGTIPYSCWMGMISSKIEILE